MFVHSSSSVWHQPRVRHPRSTWAHNSYQRSSWIYWSGTPRAVRLPNWRTSWVPLSPMMRRSCTQSSSLLAWRSLPGTECNRAQSPASHAPTPSEAIVNHSWRSTHPYAQITGGTIAHSSGSHRCSSRMTSGGRTPSRPALWTGGGSGFPPPPHPTTTPTHLPYSTGSGIISSLLY